MFDAAIIGGSYAGLAAALQLARARRKIAVIDAGKRRNRFASSSHGFLSQDGRAPGDIIADAKRQLLAYPSVDWIEGKVEAVENADGFALVTKTGQSLEAKRLVLAIGANDDLPDVPGLAERWGKSVFHCPYCHGYELGDGPIGVLASSEHSLHHGLMLPDWGKTIFFLNEAFEPDAEALRKLDKRGVVIERSRVLRISGEHADMELDDGRTVSVKGVFALPRTTPQGNLPALLGCTLEQTPTGAFIQVDMMKQTSVPNIFACGDAARAAGSVTFAVADGAMAGVSVHRSLMFDGL
jgi:thioredoxin reductase